MKKLTTILFSTLLFSTFLTACSKNEKPKQSQNNTASVAEAQAVPMSAQPADDNAPPVVINENNATADLGGDINETASSVHEAEAQPTETNSEINSETDNSEMENISEDAEIIDDEPASPNAPKISDNSNDNVNQKVK